MIVLDPNGEKMNLMALNVGPTHPATHHCVRLLAALDGETIVAGVHEIGFMHRGFEKMVERGTWQQVIPYTDRSLLKTCTVSKSRNAPRCSA